MNVRVAVGSAPEHRWTRDDRARADYFRSMGETKITGSTSGEPASMRPHVRVSRFRARRQRRRWFFRIVLPLVALGVMWGVLIPLKLAGLCDLPITGWAFMFGILPVMVFLAANSCDLADVVSRLWRRHLPTHQPDSSLDTWQSVERRDGRSPDKVDGQNGEVLG